MELKGKRVLVTGGAGSIGTALVERLLKEGAQVCAFDNSEDGLFRLGFIFSEMHKQGRLKLFVGDVRDYERLKQACRSVDYLFHLAAMKHVELSEYNVLDCIETNVKGVSNVVRAAIDQNIFRVVFTSSDKAVNPSSAMGATKLLGERVISAANNLVGDAALRFSSVRFGNVLDSNGSVLAVFRKCAAEGKPFPITDPEMTRFFLTLSDAIDLVFFALKNMRGGEVFVKSMGAASVITLAKAVARKDEIDTKIIGVKPGEKLFEELVTEAEAQRTFLINGIYTIIPELMAEKNLPDFSDIKNSHKNIESSLSSTIEDLDWKSLGQILENSIDILQN